MRFDIGERVKAIYPGIAVVEGKVVDYSKERYKIESDDGTRRLQRKCYVKKPDCDHELLYSKSRDEKFCPFCE